MRLGDLDALKKAIIEPLDVNDVCKNDWYEGYYTAKNEDVMAIDNAPTVETNTEAVAKDAYKQGYTDGWKERYGEPEERAQGEWIPVSERLPEALQIVLVTSKGGYVYTSCIAHGDWEYGGEVIAWQPLPEPYKEITEH